MAQAHTSSNPSTRRSLRLIKYVLVKVQFKYTDFINAHIRSLEPNESQPQQ